MGLKMILGNDWFTPTVNNRGFMFHKLTRASQSFIDFSKTTDKPVLDIGCAYGNVVLPILKHRKQIVAVDMEALHLELLKQKVSPEQLPYLTIIQGDFPEETHFNGEHFSAAHLSYILHFLPGKKILQGLKKLHAALQDGGKLYINACTPFTHLIKQKDEYEQRVASGIEWPGEMGSEFLNQDVFDKTPKATRPDFVHFLDANVLGDAIEKTGFSIEESYYFDVETPPQHPHIFGGDGKGLLSIIATKKAKKVELAETH